MLMIYHLTPQYFSPALIVPPGGQTPSMCALECIGPQARPSTPVEACNIPRFIPQAEYTDTDWYVCAWQDAVDFGLAHFASQALQDLYRFHGLLLPRPFIMGRKASRMLLSLLIAAVSVASNGIENRQELLGRSLLTSPSGCCYSCDLPIVRRSSGISIYPQLPDTSVSSRRAIDYR